MDFDEKLVSERNGRQKADFKKTECLSDIVYLRLPADKKAIEFSPPREHPIFGKGKKFLSSIHCSPSPHSTLHTHLPLPLTPSARR